MQLSGENETAETGELSLVAKGSGEGGGRNRKGTEHLRAVRLFRVIPQ